MFKRVCVGKAGSHG